MTNDVRLIDMFDILWRRRWLVGAMVAICFIGGIVSVVTAVSVYRASVSALPASPPGTPAGQSVPSQLAGLAAFTGISLGDAGMNVQETLAVLRSRSFTREFIQEENLMPILFAESWDSAAQDWAAEVKNHPSMNDAVRYFDRNVRFITLDEATGLVEVHIEWTDRELAAEWANKIVQKLNLILRNRAITDARKEEEFLRKELERTSNLEVQRSIYQLLESNIQTIMFANVHAEYALRVIDPAVVVDPEENVNLSANLKLSLSLVLGFGLGTLVALFVESLSRRSSYGTPAE